MLFPPLLLSSWAALATLGACGDAAVGGALRPGRAGEEGTSSDDAGRGSGADDGAAPPDVTPSTPAGPRKTEPKPLPVADGFYPRVILRSNGTITASVVRFLPSGRMGATIFESADGGVSFVEIGAVDDAINSGGMCCGTLFELPRALGTMPAGTLLWSASSGGDSPDAPMTIPLWKSTDGGRLWTYVTRIAVAGKPRKNGGLWEPELSTLDDGTLVCHWSDETDAGHSQKLIEAKSSDGIAWGSYSDTVALPTFGARPGMPTVRRLPGGRYVLSYEICGVASDHCTAWLRTSNDGWSWGDPASAGTRPTTIDGSHFRHAPTLAWASAPGANGRFLMVGQVVHREGGDVGPANGRVLFANTEGAGGYWFPIPAPVPVPDAYDNFCPNYSSSILALDHGTVALELASRYDGTTCRTYFARSPLVETSDGAEVADGASFRLSALISGLCLEVGDGSTAGGANVRQWTCNASPAQRWRVARKGDGTLSLRAEVSGMCLTVAGNATEPGANVEQRPCGEPGQAWRLRAVGVGHYALVKEGANVCLDVASGSTSAGANVAQWTCNDLAPQIWRFEPL